MKQSNHKLLFTLFKPLLFRIVRPVIQKVVAKQIADSFTKGDAFAYEIHKDAQRAAEAAKDDPENAQNIYSRYVSAAQKRITDNKQKTQNVASNTKVNMAVTQQDSIFKNISLPGGISTKATEFKELAAKGDRWESPVFGIGSAAASTDIPRLTPVSRKPHNAASGNVRGSGIPQTHGTSSNTFGTGNNSGGFTNQVDQAFSRDGDQDLSLKSKPNGNPTTGGTTLGSNNPVLSGNA